MTSADNLPHLGHPASEAGHRECEGGELNSGTAGYSLEDEDFSGEQMCDTRRYHSCLHPVVSL